MNIMSGTAIVLMSMLAAGNLGAAEYVIDGSGAGMHTTVTFRASHLGISALWGRFNDISGHFTYDPTNVSAASITVGINPASIDTNLEARDEHLRSADYMNVERYPSAGFSSTMIKELGEDRLQITGDFTLHGVTREITFEAVRTGEGETYFGDYRVGFEAETILDLSDYNIELLPLSQIKLILAIEGIRQ